MDSNRDTLVLFFIFIYFFFLFGCEDSPKLLESVGMQGTKRMGSGKQQAVGTSPGLKVSQTSTPVLLARILGTSRRRFTSLSLLLHYSLLKKTLRCAFTQRLCLQHPSFAHTHYKILSRWLSLLIPGPPASSLFFRVLLLCI